MIARLEADGSKTAQRLLASMIRREDVDQLASSAIPRIPRPSIAKRSLGANTAIIVTGFVLAGIALPLSIAGFVMFPLFQVPGWWIAFGISIPGIVGLFLIIFGFRWRKRRMRLLTHGQWIESEIGSVEPTNNSRDGEVLHEVSFQGLGRDDVHLKIQLGTDPSRIARQMMYNKKRTCVLIDPDHQDRGLWLEGWVVENIPD